ncbi:MAG: GNAT family N-acetyltransferase, partial [Tomitella sp.]|nr:GNAT family N-acetyltransferase [Tomitella sp.]
PRMREYHGPDEASPAHAERLFETFQTWASERPRRNYQLAVVQRRAPFALMGCCGLRGAEHEAGGAELGIEFAPDYWGRYGYAVEVGQALLAFGFGELRFEVITGSTVSANARVARLVEWFGAEVQAIRPGPEWMAARDWKAVEWRIGRERWEQWRSQSDSSKRPTRTGAA